MNNDNLRPVQDNTKLSQSEARALSRKGGIRSGEVRREKAEMNKQIDRAIDHITKRFIADPQYNEDKEFISTIGADIYMLVKIAFDPEVKPEVRAKYMQE